MKEGLIADPNIYLGSKLRKTRLKNGVIAWSMSASKYVQETVAEVEEHLKKERPVLSWKASTPLSFGYIPELDVTDNLETEEANYLQSQIDILQWMVELG